MAGLSVCGLILSPLIPSAIAKVALTSPLALGISESMGFADQSKGSAGLGFTSLIFSGLFIPFFLTASYVNFMVLGMIPGEYISWLEWFWWSMPLMIFFSVCMFGVISLLFKPENLPKKLSKQLLKDRTGHPRKDDAAGNSYTIGIDRNHYPSHSPALAQHRGSLDRDKRLCHACHIRAA